VWVRVCGDLRERRPFILSSPVSILAFFFWRGPVRCGGEEVAQTDKETDRQVGAGAHRLTVASDAGCLSAQKDARKMERPP